jgi:hypothetical protein
LVAIAEEFGDQGRRYLRDEVLDGGVAGTEKIDASIHSTVR